MRVTRALAAAAAALLVGVADAAAHEGNPDFRSEISSIVPRADGLTAQVLNFDDSLQLENRSGLDVVVLGYEGEPYARIRADGTVELNRNSTGYYLNDDRYAAGRVPAGVDPRDPPEWERLDGSGTLTWHDHRIHWMSESRPPQVSDESRETKIFDYEVPIEVGGRPGRIAGTLTWVGRDSGLPLAPFVALGALALAAGALVLAVRRRRSASAEDEAW